MPNAIQNDTFHGVLPFTLNTAFSFSREWAALISEYKDGSSQRREQVATSRKSYSFSKRLTAAQMDTLRTFYFAHLGQCFKVYLKQADLTAGNDSYKLMRFEGGWSEEITLGRSNVSITLIEVA